MKIFVALSGGVDSAVSAAMLKDEGHDVTGVYMKNWSGDDYGLQGDCPWEVDQKDAESVAEHLGIEFRSVNFEKEYREKVVEYFFAEYEAGRTPNPDVMCNKEIKFKLFLDRAMSEGADMIATGHYVRKTSPNPSLVRRGNSLPLTKGELEGVMLLKGVDSNKDQSYFLNRITQEQLQKSLFPVGGYTKPEIRELAKKYGLPNANKPDSQGICFIGHINVRDFLKERLGEKSGEIIDIDSNKVVGDHNGSYFYTIGQREGLRIGGVPEPYFVVKTDIKENKVYVAMGSNNPQLFKSEVMFNDLHLINNVILSETKNLKASIRYRHPDQPGTILLPLPREDREACLAGRQGSVFKFTQPQRAVTPGQSIVFYDGEVCLGGGVIV